MSDHRTESEVNRLEDISTWIHLNPTSLQPNCGVYSIPYHATVSEQLRQGKNDENKKKGKRKNENGGRVSETRNIFALSDTCNRVFESHLRHR
jgi:hypothetical protein